MSFKQKLSQYTDIKEEIKRLEKRIEKLEETETDSSDSVEGSSKYFPYEKKHIKVKGTDIERIHKLEKLKSILKERYDKLLRVQIEVEEFIDEIPTSRLRRIFEYRYLNGYSWVKVSQLIGGTSTDDSVRKEHDRFLLKK